MLQRRLINGDWTFGGGQQDYISGIEKIKQDLSTRLKEWVGNCFFNKPAGIDYLNLLGVGTKNALIISIRSKIVQTSDINSLEELSVNIDKNRQLKLEFTVGTIYNQNIQVNLNL